MTENFTEQYTSTLQALDDIALQCKDRKTVDSAKSLSRAMSDPTFIVSLCCAQTVMGVTITLSRTLQNANQDLFEAMESVEYVLATLQR